MTNRRYPLHLNFLWRHILLIAIALHLLTGFGVVYADSVKIGVVNTEKILRESQPALEAHKKIDQEFLPRDAEIKEMAEQAKVMQEKLEKKGAAMSDVDRRELERELANLSRSYQRAQRQMREDLTARQNEEYGVILDLIDKAIKHIAEKERYDLILQLQDSVYRSQRIDITNQVIEALDSRVASQ
ncbi:MAG: OmpH family outer membrane protein [Nitrosomonas sp.]|nr:OmpH family outer membrane protein [Nitrosomonas sp.]MCW5618444.1 OmpH family outer membrane protein [Nitrosomonas sp.]